jgi:hypothetical protein
MTLGCNVKTNRRRSWIHDHVNVFEQPAWGNALGTVCRLNQVVTAFAAVLPAKHIDEVQWLGKLLSSDQESGAIHLPFAGCFVHVLPP